MTVCGADVRPVDCVRDLGVLIDSNMTLSNHVNNVAGIFFYQLRQLRIIRMSLTTDAHSLVRALIHTRIDYCNGLLAAGTCTRSYSPSSVPPPDLFCSSHIVRLFPELCEDSCTGSRCQIVSDSNCVPLYTDVRTDSLLPTSLISARLPQSTLI